MKELIGKVIKAIFVSEGEDVLAFDTDAGVIAYGVDGDCCSESWFADITGVQSLLDGKVIDANDVDMPDCNIEDGRSRQEEDKLYGFKITTDKGYSDIVFRNSSNGYYGGSCYLLIDTPKLSLMKKITDDWQA